MSLILRTNLRPLDKDNGQPGIYAPSFPGWNSTSTVPSASRAYWARFEPSRNMTIASIAFNVIGLGADSVCDVGIYSSDLQTRLGVSTAAAGRLNSVGVKNIALAAPVALLAGVTYHAAMSFDAAVTAQVAFAVVFGAGTASLFGTTVGTVEMDFKAASHPLPTTLTGTGGGAGAPMLALREA